MTPTVDHPKPAHNTVPAGPSALDLVKWAEYELPKDTVGNPALLGISATRSYEIAEFLQEISALISGQETPTDTPYDQN